MGHHQPEFHYCPVCGGKLNQVVLKEIEPARLVCSACRFVLYMDPKVVACTVVEQDDRIVLLKRAMQPQKGRWVMPGGFVDRGEEIRAAALRETEEECGLMVRVKRLLGVYSYPGNTQVVVVYTAQYVSGDIVAGDETLEARFFEPRDIPWDRLAFQSTTDALKDYFR
ncbi:MAG: NUDIX hydrolase [Desulfatiglandaceae bacterium]|jgi:ADP-ribose pyrophosphatase YjhB (NUDIX family)